MRTFLSRCVLGAGLLLCLQSSLFAWGPIGHMTVAYIAYQRLSPATKARVRDLLKLNPDYPAWESQIPAGTSPEDHDRIIFVSASVWADDIKGEARYSDDGPDPGGNLPGGPSSAQNTGYGDVLRHRYWHFVDIPFSPDGAKLPEIPTPNAETQIDAFRAVLASSESDALKSYDLVWLLHLIGDIHQPLHATNRIIQEDPQGDAGGNKVKLFGDLTFNLHAYWDDLPGTADPQFCAKKLHCVDRATVLGNSLPPAPAAMVKQMKTAVWVHESFEDARRVVYQAPIGPKEGPYSIAPWSRYEEKSIELVKARLAQAGARLAEVLNQELK